MKKGASKNKMRRTKDQIEIGHIIELAKAAELAAYSLFSRRLDAQRNIDSFLLLREAFKMLEEAREVLEEAEFRARDSKASSETTVMEEILIRGGRLSIVDRGDEPAQMLVEAVVLPFPKK